MKTKTLITAGLALTMAAGLAGTVSAEEQPEKHIKIYTNLSEANTTYHVWDDILKAYQAEVNPNFTWEVEVVPDHDQYLDKLKLYIAGGNMPDIYQIPNGALSVQLAQDGKMVNIGEELKAMDMYDAYNGGCLDFVKFDDGSLYLFPDGRYAELFWYWTGDFEELNLEVPRTWDEFVNCCAALKESGKDPIAMAGSESWQSLRYVSFMPWVTGGGEFINKLKTGEIKYDEDEIAVKGTELLYTLASNDYFMKGYENTNYADNINAFANHAASISYFGPNDLSEDMQKAYENGEIGFFPVPYVDGMEDDQMNIPVHSGKAWGINKDSYDEELQRFFEFFVKHHTQYSMARGVYSPLDEEGDSSNMPKVMMDVLESLQKVEKGWVSWDDKLDPATITTSGELGIELSQALIDPETFREEMDLSIEENAAEYFGAEE